MQPVDSSTIAAVDFEPGDPLLETGTLTVVFKSGGTFRYFDVPEDAYAAMLDSDSKGKYFAQHIKKQFRGEKQDVVETDDYGAPKVTTEITKPEAPGEERIPIRMGTIEL